MEDGDTGVRRPDDVIGRLLFAVSRAFAIAGGIVLCAMAVLTTVSIVGRSLATVIPSLGPVPGDFELIAIGTGVAVFAFLPYCQMTGGNVVVDFFLEKAPGRVKSGFDVLGGLLYGVIVVLFTWRTTVGGIGIHQSAETTYILSIPRWWTFPAAILCLVLLTCVCLYTLWRHLHALRSGQDVEQQ